MFITRNCLVNKSNFIKRTDCCVVYEYSDQGSSIYCSCDWYIGYPFQMHACMWLLMYCKNYNYLKLQKAFSQSSSSSLPVTNILVLYEFKLQISYPVLFNTYFIPPSSPQRNKEADQCSPTDTVKIRIYM